MRLRDPGRDYLVLAQRLDRLLPGTVDTYTGDIGLIGMIQSGLAPDPGDLVRAAGSLTDNLPADLGSERARFLRGQLHALEWTARRLTRQAVPYVDAVERPAPLSRRVPLAGDGERGRAAAPGAAGQLVAHEGYPGHHTERCRKEAGLVARGWEEHRVVLANSPQSLIAEGTAELGLHAVLGPGWGGDAAEVLAGVGLGIPGELAEQVDAAGRAHPRPAGRRDHAARSPRARGRGARPPAALDARGRRACPPGAALPAAPAPAVLQHHLLQHHPRRGTGPAAALVGPRSSARTVPQAPGTSR